jgi:hypothetical protein
LIKKFIIYQVVIGTGWLFLDSVSVGTAGASTLLNGLVGYWKFDETSGTNLADATAGSHNATLGSGTVNQTGKIGKAVTYNNTGYATIPYAAFSSITDKETISFWFYPTSLPSTVTRNEGYLHMKLQGRMKHHEFYGIQMAKYICNI